MLLGLVLLGLLPSGFALWLSAKLDVLSWMHGAALVPGLLAGLLVYWIQRQSKCIPFWLIWFTILVGILGSLCALGSWAHLVGAVCWEALRIRPRVSGLPGWTFPGAFFLLLSQGYLLWSVVVDGGRVFFSRALRGKVGEKSRYGMPLPLEPDEEDALKIRLDCNSKLLKIFKIGLAHDARCAVNEGGVELGIALLLLCNPEQLKLLLEFSELRRAFGDTRALREVSGYFRDFLFRLELREFWFTPFTPWFWGVWVGRSVAVSVGAAVERLALEAALGRMRERHGEAMEHALRAQGTAGDWLLVRIWTAIEHSRAFLRRLKEEKPVRNLFRIEPSDAYAQVPADPGELARVTGLLPHVCAWDGFEARAAKPDSQLDRMLKKYEKIFTQRILCESLVEYRMHAAALGVSMDNDRIKPSGEA